MNRLSLSILSLLLLSACLQKKAGKVNPDGSLSGEISLSGAFALYPLAVQWAAEFQQLHPNVKVDVSAGGAGKGITDALAGVVDFGMVSRELGQAELDKGAVPFAVGKDAVVPTMNIRNTALKDILRVGLKQKTFRALWETEKIYTWGQLAGTRNASPVVVYTRSDACGAGETWADYLGLKQEDLYGTAVYGDPGVASAVQRDVNAIGFNNIGYAFDSETGKPNQGIVVVPIDLNDNGKIDADENFYHNQRELTKAIADGKYPMPPARNLYLVSRGVPTDPVVKEFLKFILTKGQQANEPQGYVRISGEQQAEGLARLHFHH